MSALKSSHTDYRSLLTMSPDPASQVVQHASLPLKHAVGSSPLKTPSVFMASWFVRGSGRSIYGLGLGLPRFFLNNGLIAGSRYERLIAERHRTKSAGMHVACRP